MKLNFKGKPAMSRLLAAVVLLALPSAAWAQVSQEDFDKLRKDVEDLERRVAGAPEGQEPPERGGLYSRLGSFSRRVHLGGYIDLEYFNVENSKLDTFDQHRLVPFIFADVTENITVATEIEIEHGGELGVEFAAIDYWMKDWINFRAGILLLPLGKFNLVHDAPLQDLTDRPLVDQWIIPAVLRDPGVSIFGQFESGSAIFGYELAVSNGFKGLNQAGTTSLVKTSNGLRDARPQNGTLGKAYRDFNDNKAVTGRFWVQPFLGLEVGVSGHSGKYDEKGDGDLTIWAVDTTLKGGGLYNQLIGSGAETLRSILFATEIVLEVAAADVESTPVSPVAQPEDLFGYFVEFRYHFFFEAFRSIPGTSDESTFTAVFRLENVDLDGFETQRLVFGLNFRPIEETVFKIEVQLNEESGDKTEVDDDAVIFSVATYF